MKLIIQGDRIAGTATEEYPGPEFCIEAPEWFAIDNMSVYKYLDGKLIDPTIVEPPSESIPIETPVTEDLPVDGAI